MIISKENLHTITGLIYLRLCQQHACACQQARDDFSVLTAQQRQNVSRKACDIKNGRSWREGILIWTRTRAWLRRQQQKVVHRPKSCSLAQKRVVAFRPKIFSDSWDLERTSKEKDGENMERTKLVKSILVSKLLSSNALVIREGGIVPT